MSVPDIIIFLYGNSCSSLFSALFFFSVFEVHSALGMSLYGKRKRWSENEAEREMISGTAVLKNGKIREY